MMIVDRRTLFLLSFNFVHMDIEHSRGFRSNCHEFQIVSGGDQAFRRRPESPTLHRQPQNFIVESHQRPHRALGFYQESEEAVVDLRSKIADKQILKLLEERAKAGIDLKIIGSLGVRGSNLLVTRSPACVCTREPLLVTDARRLLAARASASPS